MPCFHFLNMIAGCPRFNGSQHAHHLFLTDFLAQQKSGTLMSAQCLSPAVSYNSCPLLQMNIWNGKVFGSCIHKDGNPFWSGNSGNGFQRKCCPGEVSEPAIR